MSQNTPTNYSEDEIDLKALFTMLWSKKAMIAAITATTTILAAIYAFSKTPIYEAKALVEIGNYQAHSSSSSSSSSSSKIALDSANSLAKKLNVLFIDVFKDDKDREFKISSISVPKKANNFIEIKAEALSNEIAKRELLGVVNHIKTQHQKILDDVKNQHELEISHLNNKIATVKNKEVQLLSEKITIQTQNLQDYQVQLKQIEQNVRAIEKTNPTLAALKLMEKRDLSAFIVELNLQLIDMKSKKDELETTVTNQLVEQKQRVESMLLPHNYKNSAIVGQVITSEYPIKPKKRLIVAIALIAGFILSIFWVLLSNAFRTEEKTQ